MNKHRCKKCGCYGYEPFTAWLIEMGSPALWWRGNVDGAFGIWTDDAYDAMHFTNRASAKMEMNRIINARVKGNLSVTGHMFNCGADNAES